LIRDFLRFWEKVIREKLKTSP